LQESELESVALSWLYSSGFTVLPGPSIAPGELAAERTSYEQVILEDRLRAALKRLNPCIPADGWSGKKFHHWCRATGCSTDGW
jgi:type I restriction enzyme R subunit